MPLRKFFKLKYFRFHILIALVLGFSGNINAQEESMSNVQEESMVVQSVGTGIIRGNDIPAAREEALAQAMVSSVQSVLSELIPAQRMALNFKKIDESIFAKIGDYILEYKVLAENSSDKTYRIMIESTLFAEKIQTTIADLDSAPAETEFPKVLFFLAEQNVGDILPSYWWGEDPTFVKGHSEKAIAKELTGHGLSVIEHEGMLMYQSGTTFINNPYLSNEEAMELGKQLKADIVVVGTAMAQALPETTGQIGRSFRAELSIRAIRIDKEEEIISISKESVVVSEESASGGRDALKNAAELAGKDLVRSIVDASQNSESTSLQVDILVRGTSNLGNFVSFRKSLSQIPGVKNIRIKETMADEASLVIDYEGSVEALAGILMQKSFDNFRINVLEIGREHMSMDLIPGQNVYRP